jgi:hypothetical protein
MKKSNYYSSVAIILIAYIYSLLCFVLLLTVVVYFVIVDLPKLWQREKPPQHCLLLRIKEKRAKLEWAIFGAK